MQGYPPRVLRWAGDDPLIVAVPPVALTRNLALFKGSVAERLAGLVDLVLKFERGRLWFEILGRVWAEREGLPAGSVVAISP